jgi:hypothetical protein
VGCQTSNIAATAGRFVPKLQLISTSFAADNQGMVIPVRILTLALGAVLLATGAMTLLLVAARS